MVLGMVTASVVLTAIEVGALLALVWNLLQLAYHDFWDDDQGVD